MAIQGLRITVGTTPTILTSFVPADPIAYNQKGYSVMVQNPSTTVTVFLGGADVSSSVYGFSLAPQQVVSIDLDGGENLYAAVSSSTQTVNVLRKGV